MMLLLVMSAAVLGQVYGTEHMIKEPRIAPRVGLVSQVTAGSVMLDRETRYFYRAARLGGPLKGAGFNSGVKVFPIDKADGEVVACQYDVYALAQPASKSCLIDPEGDGTFNLAQKPNALRRELKVPASYDILRAEIYEKDKLKQSLIYLGVSGSTLRLSYREFVNDMARPAFTEEITFTLSGKYPEPIAYKDLSIDILSVGNAGLRYVIRKAD